MWYILTIYFVMFFANPVIIIALNKEYPNSMGIDFLEDSDRMVAFIMSSLFWPFAIFYEFYSLLDYWYLN